MESIVIGIYGIPYCIVGVVATSRAFASGELGTRGRSGVTKYDLYRELSGNTQNNQCL